MSRTERGGRFDKLPRVGDGSRSLGVVLINSVSCLSVSGLPCSSKVLCDIGGSAG